MWWESGDPQRTWRGTRVSQRAASVCPTATGSISGRRRPQRRPRHPRVAPAANPIQSASAQSLGCGCLRRRPVKEWSEEGEGLSLYRPTRPVRPISTSGHMASARPTKLARQYASPCAPRRAKRLRRAAATRSRENGPPKPTAPPPTRPAPSAPSALGLKKERDAYLLRHAPTHPH